MAVEAGEPAEEVHENQLRLELPARAENVGVARVAVAAFAAQLPFSINELEDLKVAVSEAVTNVVVHAYPAREGAVMINAYRQDRRLVVVVSDRGVGIEDVSRAREASFSTREDRMGLGFSFMASFTDSLEVAAEPGAGTRVRFEKVPREAVERGATRAKPPAGGNSGDEAAPAGDPGAAE